MKVGGLLRMWLGDNVKEHRDREARARKAYREAGPILRAAAEALADCHAAAALIYETELSKLGKETR